MWIESNQVRTESDVSRRPGGESATMPRFESVRDVLEFAIAKEAEAQAFYTKLARRVTDPALRKEVKSFALDELRHGIRLQAIKEGETAFLDDEVGSLGIAETVPQVRVRSDMSYKDLLILAMDREKAAFRIYSNLASIAKTRECRDTLLLLAQEEARHKLRLEIEYDLVSF